MFVGQKEKARLSLNVKTSISAKEETEAQRGSDSARVVPQARTHRSRFTLKRQSATSRQTQTPLFGDAKKKKYHT